LASIEHLEKHPELVSPLRGKTIYARNELKKCGLKPLAGDSAIIPIIVGETSRAIAISEALLKDGIYAIGFGFPVVKEGEARIRLQISDALSYEDIDRAVKVLMRNV
jgi:glycine C-acetyltransferase